jgi:hypothetical protein
MTGKIIPFQSHRDLKRGRLCREQTASRRVVPEACNAQILELQLAHIAHLLAELEELICASATCPPAALT